MKPNSSSKTLLRVDNLSVTFTMYEAGLQQRQLNVITGLDLDVEVGEVMAIVGSSGSGKSLLAHAILGILPANASISGEIYFQDELLTAQHQAELRGKAIALIPQSVAFLDPLMHAGTQVCRAGYLSGLEKKAAPKEQRAVFLRYGLAENVERLFPFQISGGMARRVLTATAAIGNAKLLIADEPTPGLHPDAISETLNHLRHLANEGRGVILITHDIESALRVADRVAVFYAGTTIEIARAADFTGQGERLRHPYSKALWQALPQNQFIPIAGAQPLADSLPAGCLFAPRCPIKSAACEQERPSLRTVAQGKVRCIHA